MFGGTAQEYMRWAREEHCAEGPRIQSYNIKFEMELLTMKKRRKAAHWKMLDKFNNQILDAAITARAIDAAGVGRLSMPKIIGLLEKAKLAWFKQIDKDVTHAQ